MYLRVSLGRSVEAKRTSTLAEVHGKNVQFVEGGIFAKHFLLLYSITFILFRHVPEVPVHV